MAAESIPERVRWAVRTLAIDPGDQLLEIGCGPGVAVSMICDRLDTGTILALDRSASMVERAERRNREHISSGKAAIRTADLETADLGGELFDKVFAINVNLFWVRSPAGELDLIRRALNPTGSLHLFYEPPEPSRIPDLADKLVAVLTGNGFTATTLTTATLLCVAARTR